jgi:retron-type reverse transcriptase
MNVRNKVSDLQSKLSHAAKQSLDRRFGALYDKIYREDVIAEAWKRVRANKGAPGVDKQDFEHIENVIGAEPFLRKVQEQLKRQRYKPQPVLRCYIEKPGKPEKRPLGIPAIFDRVCQMATKLVIEPIFETNFLECSHGFRQGRSTHDAIRIIDRQITFKRQRQVIDADLVGFFYNIRQDFLLNLVARRIKVEDGFDFLGVHFRLCSTPAKYKKVEKYCAIWPSDRSIERIKQRVTTVIGRRYSQTPEALITELNPILRG